MPIARGELFLAEGTGDLLPAETVTNEGTIRLTVDRVMWYYARPLHVMDPPAELSAWTVIGQRPECRNLDTQHTAWSSAPSTQGVVRANGCGLRMDSTMDLIGTSDLIDEILVNSAEMCLSKDLMEDFKLDKKIGTRETIRLYTEALDGIIRDHYVRKADGSPFGVHILDKKTRDQWIAMLNESLRYYRVLDEALKQADTPKAKQARKLVLAVTRVMKKSRDLIKSHWTPEKRATRFSSDAANYFAKKLDVDLSSIPGAKKTRTYLGLTMREYYQMKGVFYPAKNVIHVRRDLFHRLESIVERKATIAHETAHAVTVLLASLDNATSADKPFLEGLAELLSYDFLEERLNRFRDWTFLIYQVAYKGISHPGYVRFHQRARRLLDLGGYRLFTLLLVQNFPMSLSGSSVERGELIKRIHTIAKRSNRKVASILVKKAMALHDVRVALAMLYFLGRCGRRRLFRLAEEEQVLRSFIDTVKQSVG